MLSTTLVLILAILNNLPITKPPSPINITAPTINVTAPPMNVTAPPINAIAPIKVAATTNYSRDLVTLVKIYTEESKYSREDNNFNRKLIIFNDLYNRVKIL
jgi:hypothetical protein